MNTMFGWMINKRIWGIAVVVMVTVVSLYVSVRGIRVEASTDVERQQADETMGVSTEVEMLNADALETVEKQQTENPLVVKRRKCTYPKKIYEGQPFSLKGTLKSNHEMKKIVAAIVSEDGKEQCKVTKQAKGTTFRLSKVDSKIRFSELNAGKYTYEVSVIDEYGNDKQALKKSFQVEETKYLWPIEGGVLGDDFRCHCPSHRGKHYGIDIKGVSKGTKIHAIQDGEVVYAQYHGGTSKGAFGKLVVLYHGNGKYSYYAHCNAFRCEVGDEVKRGDVIATVGNTGRSYGTHLHLELRKGPEFNGKYNHYKFLDKYTYKQFNPLKKNYLQYAR